MKRCAFHSGHELNRASIAYIKDEAIDDLVAEIAVGHLTTFETERRFDLVAVPEETNSLIFFGLVVVLVYGDGELDFLDGDDLLLFARGAFALVLLVEIFAVVLDFADGRNGIGRNFYEVEGTFASHLESFEGRHDAKLFAVLVDNTDFACANAFVGADERLCGTFIDWWNRSLHSGLTGSPCIVFGFGATYLPGCAGTRSISLSC